MSRLIGGFFDNGTKIKGTVVLMPKNVLDFNALTSIGKGGVTETAKNIFGQVLDAAGNLVDAATAFAGRNISLHLISATQADGLFSSYQPHYFLS